MDFDFETAAKLLNGEKVKSELVSRFVVRSKWAHEEVSFNRNKIIDMTAELTKRDLEIALLKEMLLDFEEQIK